MNTVFHRRGSPRRYRITGLGACALSLCVANAAYPYADRNTSNAGSLAPAAAPITKHLALQPMRFETNVGQTDRRVDFIARGEGYSLYLTPNEAVLALKRAAGPRAHADRDDRAGRVGTALRMRLLGAKRPGAVAGSERLPGR